MSKLTPITQFPVVSTLVLGTAICWRISAAWTKHLEEEAQLLEQAKQGRLKAERRALEKRQNEQKARQVMLEKQKKAEVTTLIAPPVAEPVYTNWDFWIKRI